MEIIFYEQDKNLYMYQLFVNSDTYFNKKITYDILVLIAQYSEKTFFVKSHFFLQESVNFFIKTFI